MFKRITVRELFNLYEITARDKADLIDALKLAIEQLCGYLHESDQEIQSLRAVLNRVQHTRNLELPRQPDAGT